VEVYLSIFHPGINVETFKGFIQLSGFVRIGIPKMLETIAVILIILWALGLVTSYTMGGFIHVLLIIAIVVVLVRVIQGRSL
jgi:hypothetical protein